jgi:hypothetical protein
MPYLGLYILNLGPVVHKWTGINCPKVRMSESRSNPLSQES